MTARPATWQLDVADVDLETLAGLLAADIVRLHGATSPEARARRAVAQRMHAQILDALGRRT